MILQPSVPMECLCGAAMTRRTSKYGLFYGCSRYPLCEVTVGCHRDGRPLGTPTDAPGKLARIAAHAAFDQLWKPYPKVERAGRRHQAYAWLRVQMGLSVDGCHMGMFTKDQCQKVVELVLHVPPWPPLAVPVYDPRKHRQEGPEYAREMQLQDPRE